ncbi:hypothetical protein MNBD_BACTEROID02-1433 [hydrothermal vent metagenome]|uniref:Uncharacterized protein n=1 Tax=hydrothermal vent metagenome TaxID=652676 RepID=A0A3B0R0N4_9ZZZZ
MGLFSKDKIAEQVFVKGKKLTCNTCSHDKFTYRKTQLNTALASFFDLDWANKSAHCYVCEKCTKIQWFLNKL